MEKLSVYIAKCYRDKPLRNHYKPPGWAIPIQVGAALTDVRVADVLDCEGENISVKNGNYSELTALYWIWRNCLKGHRDSQKEYYGLFHYRRILDIREDDIGRMIDNELDAVLPFPTLHEPDISEHHRRYITESDWKAMLLALGELAPDYMDAYQSIFSQRYLYNFNILIAKRDVLLDYCEWLFPILERTEALSVPKGNERSDRYIGYLGENLMTLYFFYNQRRLRVAHTGRLMLT